MRVLRSGFCKSGSFHSRAEGADFKGQYVTSSELVPGDVYEITDPSLEQFPADGLLLSGDCIVNESMLTGKTFSYPHIKLFK